jgi:hypothetical protein
MRHRHRAGADGRVLPLGVGTVLVTAGKAALIPLLLALGPGRLSSWLDRRAARGRPVLIVAAVVIALGARTHNG